MIGNVEQPAEPLYSQVQEIQDGIDAARDAEARRLEIGYRIDYYPQQTTGQQG
jgi:hypothetical protein